MSYFTIKPLGLIAPRGSYIVKKIDFYNIYNINTNIKMEIEPQQLYESLLDEIYININQYKFNDIKLTPINTKILNKKTYWSNYNINCKEINRDPEHLKKFLEKELKAKIALDGDKNIVIHAMFKNPVIFSIYKKYIEMYVQCSVCKNINSDIIKNKHTKNTELICNNQVCKYVKFVNKI